MPNRTAVITRRPVSARQACRTGVEVATKVSFLKVAPRGRKGSGLRLRAGFGVGVGHVAPRRPVIAQRRDVAVRDRSGVARRARVGFGVLVLGRSPLAGADDAQDGLAVDLDL